MPAKVEVLGLAQTKRNMEDLAEALHGREMVEGMYEAVNVVLADVKRFSPVDTGRLKNSISGDVSKVGFPSRRLQGVVGTNIEYAPYMEEGTGTPAGHRPVNMPPIAALEGWARRHGANAYRVARAIYLRGGLEPRRMFLRSLQKNERRVVEILDNKVRILIQRMD